MPAPALEAKLAEFESAARTFEETRQSAAAVLLLQLLTITRELASQLATYARCDACGRDLPVGVCQACDNDEPDAGPVSCPFCGGRSTTCEDCRGSGIIPGRRLHDELALALGELVHSLGFVDAVGVAGSLVPVAGLPRRVAAIKKLATLLAPRVQK